MRKSSKRIKTLRIIYSGIAVSTSMLVKFGFSSEKRIVKCMRFLSLLTIFVCKPIKYVGLDRPIFYICVL